MHAKESKLRRWIIEDFEFDEETSILRQGEHAVEVKGNQCALLKYLILTFSKCPKPTNNDIMNEIWKRLDAEANLHQTASILRKAFGSVGREYLATKPHYHLLKKPAPVYGSFEGDARWFLKKTYYGYRDEQCPRINDPELVPYLEKRYHCNALELGCTKIAVSVIWENRTECIFPDQILGRFDFTNPIPFHSSTTLTASEYRAARQFIEAQYQAGIITYEGCDYRMTSIELGSTIPKVNGAFGLYYDNILTQYAMEWELKKALLSGHKFSSIDTLLKPGTLPLRESVEAHGNPLFSGEGRCAAITISTLLIFKRSRGNFSCLIRRRSMEVGVSPGMLHVVPAGMFEASNTHDKWSIELNVWRELLEEVYSDPDALGSSLAELTDHLRGREPIKLLCKMLQKGSAEFSVTGIVCDLLNLRPEICTVLYINDSAFVESREMKVNWEYEPEHRFGKFAVEWARIDEVIDGDGAKYGIVASGAGCIALGREWARNRHGL